MESNVKIPFVTPEQLLNPPRSPSKKNLDAIDEINRAKALLGLIISSANEDGVAQAAESGITHLSKAIESLDDPKEVVENSRLRETETERKPKELTRHDYLNRAFIPEGVRDDFFEQSRTSFVAGDLWAIISTAEHAFDSGLAASVERRGISTTLQIAKHMASDLIGMCESLEWDLSQAKKRARSTGEASEAA